MIKAFITVSAKATKVCGAIVGSGGAIKVKYNTPQKRKDAPKQKRAIWSSTLVAVFVRLDSLHPGVCVIMGSPPA
jgi:hypothetical protein